MKTKPDVRAGQVWEDCDLRKIHRRRLFVNKVNETHASCTVHIFGDDRTVGLTRIRLDRFRPTASGYRLAKDVPRVKQTFGSKVLLTDRDVAQILAALRFWQSNDMTSETSLSELKDAGHFEDHAPMTTDEIDALCERINLGPAKP